MDLISEEYSMTNELTKISGIGANAAKLLEEAGFATIEAIATSTPEAISKVKGFGDARAERVIASAKELTNPVETVETVETVEPVAVSATPEVTTTFSKIIEDEIEDEVKVDPVVASTQNSKFAALRSSSAFIPTVAILILVGMIAVYSGVFGKFEGLSIPSMTTANQIDTTEGQAVAVVETGETGEVEEEIAPVVTENMNAQTTAPNTNSAPDSVQRTDMQKRFAQGLPPVEPEWLTRQRAEAQQQHAQMQKRFADNQSQAMPESIVRQRAEAEEYRIEMQKRFEAGLPPVEPKWVTRQRVEAEEYRIEMQKRFATGQPPVEPVWVTRQRAEADKYFAEAKKRHMERVEQHKAMMNQRFGTPNRS